MASASDNFNRAAGNIGANWTTTSGSWTVASSAANQVTAGGSYRSAVYTATSPATANFYSAASMRSDGTARGAGVCVRASSTAVTDYRYMGYGGDAFYLEYLSAGTPTTLDTGAACTASTTYFLRLEANGTTIAGSVNGTADVTATHATLTGGGWGLATYGQLNSTNRQMDTWDGADLSAGGAMTATMAWAFSQSATATGLGALTGTAPAVFAEAATLTGLGDLTGTAPATFDQAATLTGLGALTASAPVVFSESATLTGLGALVAGVEFVFDQSATLTDGAAPSGSLAGVIPVGFSQSATLTGQGALVGSVPAVFAETATLAGLGALVGVTAQTFSQSATLTGLGDLSGAVPVVFAETATLTGLGALTGTVDAVFLAVLNNADNSGIGPGTRYLYLSQARRTAYGQRDNADATKRQSAKSEG